MDQNEDMGLSIPEQFNMASYLLEENIVKGRGKKTAIYFKDEQYTFNDLCSLTNRIGNVLKELGVEIEGRVLLILQDSPEWVAGFFAVLKIGGIATWAYTYLQPGGYQDFVNLVRPKVIIVDDSTLDKVREGIKRTRYSPILLVAGHPTSISGPSEHSFHKMVKSASDYLETEPTSKDDIAFWNFSGGTTGKPKAVPHMHRDVVFGTEATQQMVHFTEKDIVFNVPKLFFTYARINGMETPLRAGASVMLSPEKTTAEIIFRLVEKYKPTVLVNVPTMMRSMIQVPVSQRSDLKSIRFCLSAGEALSPQLYHQWMETFGIDMVEFIGSAETYAPYLGNKPGEKVLGSTGKVVPLVKAKILNIEGGEVPRGTVGILYVQTDAAGQCYVRQHDKSKKTFVGNDWVNTSDFFREDEEGNFWYSGRSDEMVKISGVWVSVLEIERCLETHPAVKECVVLGMEDSDGLVKSKAFVALKEGFDVSNTMADELKQFCKEKLASFKSPKFIEFLDELPKTGPGKIDKRQLRERGL